MTGGRSPRLTAHARGLLNRGREGRWTVKDLRAAVERALEHYKPGLLASRKGQIYQAVWEELGQLLVPLRGAKTAEQAEAKAEGIMVGDAALIAAVTGHPTTSLHWSVEKVDGYGYWLVINE